MQQKKGQSLFVKSNCHKKRVKCWLNVTIFFSNKFFSLKKLHTYSETLNACHGIIIAPHLA